MPSTTVEIRVADAGPVRKVLAAAGDLAAALEELLADPADTDHQGEASQRLREFKATVRAQTGGSAAAQRETR